MTQQGIITENQLDEWVRANAIEAQGTIVELVYRLVAASSTRPKERRFPLGDSIGQPGSDGFLDTNLGFNPFVPEGKSFWEIGTGNNAGAKATLDYRELTKQVPEAIRQVSTFIFVTPLSGRRDWQYTWKDNAQLRWKTTRLNSEEWKDIRVIDGSGLIDWLNSFPAVAQWLADKMGLPSWQIQTPEQRWAELRIIGDPPPLPPELFLQNRDAACEKTREVFSGNIRQMKLDTYFPYQVADFVAAYVASIPDDSKVEVLGRCLIISSVEGWNSITTVLNESHILVVDFDLDETDVLGTKILERARRQGHTVIYGGTPGGIPHPGRVPIPNPKSYQVQDALEKAGYNEERARILSQKSAGNLSSLLRCLQNLSLMPEWAQGTDAADLAIAELLGGWKDDSRADIAVAENLSKKGYGEWIGKAREVALHSGTPLIQRDGAWKFTARYEGWYALGPRLFDEHLDRFKDIAVSVLRELDPKFDLSPNERYAASIYGKVLKHSFLLREGLAGSLALLGSHPTALTSCSIGKSEATATIAVRMILADGDWKLWSSLNDYLPLLAEAAPEEFLEAVENVLSSNIGIFDEIFAQEGVGITGGNYMTGLLWALENLAWSAEYLTRVVVILGELATRDPGGNWANRPFNSLSTILLPWYPQTCTPIPLRKAAISTLLEEIPEVGWSLLLDLLPSKHQTTSGSSKPTWRELIPEGWQTGVTTKDYWEQIYAYTELTIGIAQRDDNKLAKLIEHLDDLPPASRDQILAYLRSNTVINKDEVERLPLWTGLVDLISKHRKFADAEWAFDAETIKLISEVTDNLEPQKSIYRHQRLFSERDFDLLEEKGNYEEQYQELGKQRQKAVQEISDSGGFKAILEFLEIVESPWRVGIAFGSLVENKVEQNILPELLESEHKPLAQFAAGFISGRYYSRGWEWIDSLDTYRWEPSQIGQFLAYLPFIDDTWQRVKRLLVENEAYYWAKTAANPYEAKDNLEYAIDRLIEHGRPHEAIRCLQRILHDKKAVDNQLSIRALQSLIQSPTAVSHIMDVHVVVDIIKALQDEPQNDTKEILKIEWAFLPLLDRYHGGFPRLLEDQMATIPAFFCEVIRTIFRSKKKEYVVNKSQSNKDIASNAYRLLREWKTPPGSKEDGSFDTEAFTGWLKSVKDSCTESGHIRVALEMVGHVLYYAPPDPDGLWVHHSVAKAMNVKDNKNMREGFILEMSNSRGVHWVDPSGKQERDLAQQARNKAEQLEICGYYRLANSLRDLASRYEHEAERVIQEATED